MIEAATQSGGFSPGSADRVCLASGRRVFVKAVSSEVNPDSALLHRREAIITAALPPGVPAPDLLGMYDDGTWVALALVDVEGSHPRRPWADAQAFSVLSALEKIGAVTLPPGLELARSEVTLRRAFMGWEKLRKHPLVSLEPWADSNLELLIRLARRGTAAMAGESLVHGDLRADNILLTAQGVMLIDWPHANRGAPWLDSLSVLIDVNTDHAPGHAQSMLAKSRILAGVDPCDVTGVLAGWAGYYLEMSRREPPPGIDSLRSFQRKVADALIQWLRQRLGNSPGDGSPGDGAETGVSAG